MSVWTHKDKPGRKFRAWRKKSGNFFDYLMVDLKDKHSMYLYRSWWAAKRAGWKKRN